MKRKKQWILFFVLVAVMGVAGLFVRSFCSVAAQAATEQQTETSDEAASGAGEVEYQGLDEMPGIFKYMIFSLLGVVVFSIIAGIYCAVTPPRRRK